MRFLLPAASSFSTTSWRASRLEARQDAVLAAIPSVDYERISERMYVEMVYVRHSADKAPADYAAVVTKAKALGRPMVLSCTEQAQQGGLQVGVAAGEGGHVDDGGIAEGPVAGLPWSSAAPTWRP